jgi:NAD(P)-dependent dehydrogenase (short-subunit alcohol dehydrogenase family)
MAEQVVVVTGAGSGIGRAIALAFAGRGAAVIALGRKVARLEETKTLVDAAGGSCLVIPVDVSDVGRVTDAVNDAAKHFGRIDVLVNNAAMSLVAGIEDIDLAAFDAMLKLNAGGVLYACKAVWPIMKRGGGGTIVNISSMAAADPFPGLAAYGATKAFVNLLTKGLGEEGRKHNIRVFAVGPGAVETEMLRGAFPDFPAESALPPRAIADVVVTLTEPSSRYCTGQTVYVRK